MSYWLSCKRFTVFVDVDENDIICDTAPITRKFIGQPFKNLKKWASKFGGFEYVSLKETADLFNKPSSHDF